MPQEIKTISLSLPYRFGSVNCYLVKTGAGYFLIDTGYSNKRARLVKKLENEGCRSGNLKLIIITHGDFDHTANAAHLRERFGAKIAMHPDDSGMAERGDMFWNREKGNILIRKIVPVFFGLRKSDKFKADLFIEDGYDFSEYGFDAKVRHIPGHSKGSIGILTTGGDLFCGDLLTNRDKPVLNSIMDDSIAAHASIKKLEKLNVKTVYPGHGQPFPMDLWLKK